jgi:hypothetical protein
MSGRARVLLSLAGRSYPWLGTGELPQIGQISVLTRDKAFPEGISARCPSCLSGPLAVWEVTGACGLSAGGALVAGACGLSAALAMGVVPGGCGRSAGGALVAGACGRSGALAMGVVPGGCGLSGSLAVVGYLRRWVGVARPRRVGRG